MKRSVYKSASAAITSVVSKTAPAEGDASVEAPEKGVFRALVAVFGNVDSDGEVTDRGAFSESLSDRPTVPIMWSHGYGTSDIVGYSTKAEETEEGLLLEWKALDTEIGRSVAELLDAGAITDFSYSAVVESATVEIAEGEEILHLTKLDLWEAGPCLRGANPLAKLKSQDPAEATEAAADPATDDAAQRTARARLALLGLN